MKFSKRPYIVRINSTKISFLTVLFMPRNNSYQKSTSQISYSPSSSKAYHACQKKFYFLWLVLKANAWTKPQDHPWRIVYELKQLKHANTWAGELYHQVMKYTFLRIKSKERLTPANVYQIAKELAALQYDYSANRTFQGAKKSHAPLYHGMSTFLALFEHQYDTETGTSLEETQEKVYRYLATTFAWERWKKVVEYIRTGRRVHIEPENLTYTLAGAKINARMDLGIELPGGKFLLYDWKTYGENERFTELNRDSFKQQLLTYALWRLKDANDLKDLDQIAGCIFNPHTGAHLDIRFNEADVSNFELEVQNWTQLQTQLFTNIEDIDFEDLDGPFDPSRTCPWCSFKGICGKGIVWNQIR